MKKLVNVTIDGIKVSVPPKTTILQAAKKAGIKIPTLCFLKDINAEGACRVCVVENKARGNLITSCNTPVDEGQEILTTSQKVLSARKQNIELLLSNHDKDCLSCGKNLNCKLQQLSKQFNCNEHKFSGNQLRFETDASSPCITRNNNKCILCNRCVAVCKKQMATSAIAKQNRGFDTSIGCAFNKPLKDSTCVGCGQCVLACPTGALLENYNIDRAFELLGNRENIVVAQVAPAVRTAIMEEFGSPVGTFNEGKIPTALRRLGFHSVFDLSVGADFTVMEESEELLKKIKENKNLPLFSSCCPAWHVFVEKHYPNYVKNLSTCKSPNEMYGSLVKNYYYKEKGNKPENIKVVAIMPCTAKKQEILRGSDVDLVLTTRELATIIKAKNIDYTSLKDEKFDNPGSDYTSAGLIFGSTGGVTEAVLRTVVEKLSGKKLEKTDFKMVRKSNGIKEVNLEANGQVLKLCIVNGLFNAYKVMEDIIAGRKHYHFVEVMACPGGCVNGGGQPFVDYSTCDVKSVIQKRAQALYKHDNKMQLRKSQDSEAVKGAYADFLQPEVAHKYLHHHRNDKK